MRLRCANSVSRLDLLTFTPRRHIGLGLGDVSRNVSGVLAN